MTSINPSLLKLLNSNLPPFSLKQIQSKLQKQSQQSVTQSRSALKSRLSSTSASFASKPSPQQPEPHSRSPNRSPNSLQTPKPGQSQSNQSTQYRNSKGIYYRTSQLPSLHSIDSIMSECIRHTRTKRTINQYIQSSDLLKIKQLSVYYCQIESLRLFGTGWKIKSLTVIGCKLKDLSGINGFLNLECLFASYNEIEILSDLAFNQNLRVVDLEGNMISNMDEVEYMLTIDNLEMVNLDYNPVMEERKKEIMGLFGEILETQEYDVEEYDFKMKNQNQDEEMEKYQNVLLVDHINHQLQSVNCYYEMIDQLKRDKYADNTEKQFSLDGRFNQELPSQQQYRMYLLDDINMFHNPKKALQKDSVQKYLTIKFNLPQQSLASNPQSATKSKIFARRASSKKSLENKEQKQFSTISSKLSIKEEFGSTGGEFNPMGSSGFNFTDTVLSRPDSQKKRFVLRKTSLKKDSIISQMNTPSVGNRQFLSKTNSFLNK